MRFKFRKKASSKEDSGRQHRPNGGQPSVKSKKRNAESDHQERYMSTQAVAKDVDGKDTPSVISASSRSENQSESLVILLSLHSLSGLTISNRNSSPMGNMNGKRRGRKKDLSKPQKLRDTLASKATTVVVSVEREISEDGYPMETYLPSLALTEKNLWKSKLTNGQACSAYWPDAETADDRSVLNKSPPSTLQLSRNMQRVVYQRELAAERASHFLHKRIDLNISLSRGTDMLRLGTASIAIAGNEEEEQLINAPIRSFAAEDMPPRTRCWAANQRRSSNFFRDDPTKSYALADNATLCLGVRVIAEDIIQHEERIVEQERIQIMESRDTDSMDQGTPVIRLSDETDLISYPSLHTSDSQRTFSTVPAALPLLSCCAADTLSLSSLSLSSMLSRHFPGDEPSTKFYSKTTEAKVTPIYLLSDMSESTAGLTEHTDESEEVTTMASSVLFDED